MSDVCLKNGCGECDSCEYENKKTYQISVSTLLHCVKDISKHELLNACNELLNNFIKEETRKKSLKKDYYVIIERFHIKKEIFFPIKDKLSINIRLDGYSDYVCEGIRKNKIIENNNLIMFDEIDNFLEMEDKNE